MPALPTGNIMLLVDAENMHAVSAEKVIKFAKSKDTLYQVRCFGAIRGAEVEGWGKVAAAQKLRLVWEAPPAFGKNATDIMIAAAAVDLVRSQGIRKIIIASNDRDFNPLQCWLQEQGCLVWICDQSLLQKKGKAAKPKQAQVAVQVVPAPKKKPKSPKSVVEKKAPEPNRRVPTADDKATAIEVFNLLAPNGGNISKSTFGVRLREKLGTFPYTDAFNQTWKSPTKLSDATQLFHTEGQNYRLKS